MCLYTGHLQHVSAGGGLRDPALSHDRRILQSAQLLPLDDRIIVVSERLGVGRQQQTSLLLVSDARPFAEDKNSILRERKKWTLEDLSTMECEKSNTFATHAHTAHTDAAIGVALSLMVMHTKGRTINSDDDVKQHACNTSAACLRRWRPPWSCPLP